MYTRVCVCTMCAERIARNYRYTRASAPDPWRAVKARYDADRRLFFFFLSRNNILVIKIWDIERDTRYYRASAYEAVTIYTRAYAVLVMPVL